MGRRESGGGRRSHRVRRTRGMQILLFMAANTLNINIFLRGGALGGHGWQPAITAGGDVTGMQQRIKGRLSGHSRV